VSFSPEGTPGIYRATFVLAIPGKGVFRSDLDFARLMATGESLLVLGQGRHYKVAATDGQNLAEILLVSNQEGVLAQAQTRVPASTLVEAARAASRNVLPWLSWWSYRYDAAIDVAGYELPEESTGVRRWVFGCLGKSQPLIPGQAETGILSKPEYRPLFAAYREGLNATNVFYQYLCYYKVVELANKLRGRRHAANRAAGRPCRELPEQLPTDLADLPGSDQLKESLRPYLGRKYAWVLDGLRDTVRNAIAHLDPTKEVLVADEFEDVAICEQAVPVIKYLARELLRRELTADADLAPGMIL
jgi:hypothetical protein